MTARQRRIVRTAELAALAPADCTRLLAEVVAELRTMSVREADQTLAAMLAGTSRLVALAALGDLDRQRLADLSAHHEAEYRRALAREDERLEQAAHEADEIREHVQEKLANVSRDQNFLARLEKRRRGDK